uniref:Uncharacterized protein n=1 Tax=Oryza barthii TaxID=65489 RepID=A0A0D3HPV6_9ORYZ
MADGTGRAMAGDASFYQFIPFSTQLWMTMKGSRSGESEFKLRIEEGLKGEFDQLALWHFPYRFHDNRVEFWHHVTMNSLRWLPWLLLRLAPFLCPDAVRTKYEGCISRID